jgi:MSHA pilin protein MshD
MMKKGQLATGNWLLARRPEARVRMAVCSRHGRHFQHPCRSPRLASRVSNRGVTLIELVLSIVIVGIAASAVLGLLSFSAKGSADAMIRNQAVAIAQAYLEEIRFKEFTSNGVEASRGLYDDVSDYSGLNNVGARDQFDNAIAGLNDYTVTVSVGGGTLGAVSGAANVKRVDVTVQHAPTGLSVALSGYKARIETP